MNEPKKSPCSVGADAGATIENIDSIKKNSTTNTSGLHHENGLTASANRFNFENTLEAAQMYTQAGFFTLPIPFGRKGPRLKDWSNLRLQVDDLPKFFNGSSESIGVLLGEPSGGLIDIDLDVGEAIHLADEFLSPTPCEFGRKSKPRSHRLYLSNPIPETIQYQDPDGTMLVELRSTGFQTVFPPSIHPSGELISFSQNGTPESIEGLELQRKVVRLAAAALLVRYWPQQGSRQDAALALAGGLAHAKWTDTEISHFIRVVAKQAGDEESAMRANCGPRTVNRSQQGNPVTGWSRLAELIDPQVVNRLRNWLDPEGPKERIAKVRRGKGKESEKHRNISAIVIQELKAHGMFYKTKVLSELYYFDQREYSLLSIHDTEFRARINHWFDINGSESTWKFVLENIQTEAILNGTETTVHSFAHYGMGKLYIYKGENEVFLISSDGITVVPNGTDEILFLNSTLEPIPYSRDSPSASVNRILTIPNFQGSSNLFPQQEEKLFRLWLYSLFFESLLPTKPLLLFLGVKGSGKTMGLKAVLRLLLGAKGQVLTLNRDKEDAFLASVTRNYLVAFDNVDGYIKWLPNHLATVATGGDLPLRKLYTTNELVQYPVKCFLALTSRDPDSLTRDDVADRLLTLRVDRLKEFKPEGEILKEIDETRPSIWKDLLTTLQRLVLALQDYVPQSSYHRLADFAAIAMVIGPQVGIPVEEVRDILNGMDSEKSELALEHNELFPLLLRWLEEKEAEGQEWIDSATLFNEMKDMAETAKEKFPFKDSRSMSRQLKNLKTDMSEWIEVVGPQKIYGGNNKSFWKISPGKKHVLRMEEADVEEGKSILGD